MARSVEGRCDAAISREQARASAIASEFNPYSPVEWRNYGSWGGGPRGVAYGFRAVRTAVALNGAPLTVSPSRVITDSVMRVLFGNSVGSKVLAGPLTLRTGVPADIDWSRVSVRVPNAPPGGRAPRTPE